MGGTCPSASTSEEGTCRWYCKTYVGWGTLERGNRGAGRGRQPSDRTIAVRTGNVLLLRGSVTIYADYASVTTNDLIHMLGNIILEKNSQVRCTWLQQWW